MKNDRNAFHANLFYSYSHKDDRYRDNMEKALAQLRKEELLAEWSDLNILPGLSISQKIKEKLDEADIFVFLLSPDFINSNECLKEWKYAKQLSDEGKLTFRIPIILRDCSWQDLLGGDDVKALPDDGKAVANFDNEDTAWLQVYEGIKAVVNQLRATFITKPEFIEQMEETDFAAQQHIKLQDIFIFPTLSYYSPQAQDGPLRREVIEDQAELLEKKYTLIHGEDMSGKTALGRHLFLSLTNDASTPVLHIDLKEVSGKPNEKIFSDAYYRQFSGDYSVWKEQKDKVLILDNLSSDSNSIELIEFAEEIYDKIVVTLSSDVFYSYYKDESRLANFHGVKIEPLNHKQQEDLIRKRLPLSDRTEPISDGLVDQIENQVNSIIISKKVVPRYPFFVLSILQTYEAFMPANLSITSYGHCYQALIVANLVKAGISREDNDINASFNFAENLAFKIYQNSKSSTSTPLDLKEFIEEYRVKFIISDSIVNRLKKEDYGIITDDGSFRTPYMYYFFLGKFLSKVTKENEAIIERMCEQSYVSSNYLTLLFVIHHTNNDKIIDNILIQTMCTLDNVDPAKLDREESNTFKGIVEALPENVLSNESVEKERQKERETRGINDDLVETEDGSKEQVDKTIFDEIYQILKNNEIMGQILRNKYGSLEKPRIKEAIETIADSGLRVVNLLLDVELITDTAHYIHEKYPDHDPDEIIKFVQYFSFLWTMGNVEKIVNSINVPEIREIVHEVVQQKSTPAYDLIGYFNHLDSIEELTHGVRRELETLLKKHDDFFIKRVLSIRTQRYMNTHRSPARIAQSVCTSLSIRYIHKPSRKRT